MGSIKAIIKDSLNKEITVKDTLEHVQNNASFYRYMKEF